MLNYGLHISSSSSFYLWKKKHHKKAECHLNKTKIEATQGDGAQEQTDTRVTLLNKWLNEDFSQMSEQFSSAFTVTVSAF